MEITIRLPAPHPAQRKVLSEARRYNVLACGRRWGKSLLGMDRAVGPLLAGEPVGYFAPTYKILEPAWKALRSLLVPVTLHSDATKRSIQLIGGGELEMWSLQDVDAGRSRKYRRVILDEAGLVPGLADIWHEAIRPTLTDLKGDAWFLGTPKGQNFFWALHSRGQDPAQRAYASWQMPTVANPYIDPAEVEEARRELPERSYLQEYRAAFIEDGGGVFRGVSKVVDAGRIQNEPRRLGRRYLLGVDLARLEDFTALSVLDNTGRQVFHERFQEIAWERQIAAIVRCAQAYDATVLMDSTGVGDPIYERLCLAGLHVLGYQFTAQSKPPVIDALAMAIEGGELRLMDLPVQTAELQAYQYELTPSRKLRTAAPPGFHDDTVTALALANWLRSQGAGGESAVGGGAAIAGSLRW